ncbi:MULTISPECIES: OmpW/AlkL family protein [unclassified Avibacterium]|uniref:OmpW/AlkL family protein n=1 Tax=unclassified Avibacterium TaxID=2685287 RepID=UPI002026D1A6|nr:MULTISPECIES: OmpW family outer membrane protein [unclassified Avibacterium]MCW9698307.1 outer membrane beta-barrel protein [Avibacterium sp. 20-129]URL07448.1 outer membrane beta-barrel protein [Avibacterium sp. 21-595]
MKKTLIVSGLASLFIASSANAHQAGEIMLRAGGVFVSANSDSHTKTPIEVNLKVSDNAQLGLTATYMITDNIGVELLGATPFSHKIKANVPALNLNLGNVVKLKQLPPSLYVQYYFLDKNAGARPYVGAGLNYTRFFNAKSTHTAVTNLQVKKHSFAPVFNLGIDIKVADNLYLNTAMWYTRIKTTARFNALGAAHEVDVKLNPFVFFMGLGYRF